MKKGKRYEAFSINLGEDGGKTILLCSMEHCLEVFTTKGIYQIYPPESLDPKETNPDMPGMAKKVLEVGTMNWIVARVMVQNYWIGESHVFLLPKEKSVFAQKLRELMGSLLSCSEAYDYINSKVLAVERRITIEGIQAKGNIFTDFPTTEKLEERITIYLTKAKHSIQRIIDIFNLFYDSGISNPRIDLLIKWCEENDIANEVVDTLKHFEPIAEYIVKLRNSQEHPSETEKFAFSDFNILPSGEVSAPLWGVNEAKHSIHKEMNVILKEFVVFAEWLIIYLVLSKEKESQLFELRVFQIPDEHQDKECPIKYKVETCFKEKGEQGDGGKSD